MIPFVWREAVCSPQSQLHSLMDAVWIVSSLSLLPLQLHDELLKARDQCPFLLPPQWDKKEGWEH